MSSLLLVYFLCLCFFWNCQGAGSSAFIRSFRFLMNCHKPSLIGLLEPHISGIRADKVVKKLGFTYSHRVEAEGFSRGIWLLWTEDWNVDVLTNHRQFIHAKVRYKRGDEFLITMVYGSPTPSIRNMLWHNLNCLNVRQSNA